MSDGPNVSFPWGDGSPPDDLPVAGEPDNSFDPIVELESLPLSLLMRNIDVSFESLDDGSFLQSLFDSE